MTEIQWLMGVLRLGRGFRKHGDPYEFSCTVIRRGDEVELVGASGTLTPSLVRDLKDTLRMQGVKRMHFERRNGRSRKTTWEVGSDSHKTIFVKHRAQVQLDYPIDVPPVVNGCAQPVPVA